MSNKQKPCLPTGPQKNKNTNHCNSSLSQRKRLLDCLKQKPHSTLALRHQANILMPAARVYELRRYFGYNKFIELQNMYY